MKRIERDGGEQVHVTPGWEKREEVRGEGTGYGRASFVSAIQPLNRRGECGNKMELGWEYSSSMCGLCK